jgi:hypothetical protein
MALAWRSFDLLAGVSVVDWLFTTWICGVGSGVTRKAWSVPVNCSVTPTAKSRNASTGGSPN